VSQKRRKYTEEFRQEAVKLAETKGFAEAARQLGIHEGNIRKWAKKQNTKVSSTGDSVKTNSELEAEVRRLKKENEYLKSINDVLKKSTAIFSKDHIRGSK